MSSSTAWMVTLLVLSSVGTQVEMTCTNGFPDLTAPMGSLFPRGDGVTRIIPEMNISCHGTLSGWTVVGNTGPGSVNDPFPKLKVFREINRNSQTYSFVGEVDLGKCGDGFAPINENNFYTCSLSEEKQIPTQPNDIIGLFLPDLSNSAFRLSFAISTTAPTNYIFQMADVRSNISISSSPTVKNTPQLNLEITTGAANEGYGSTTMASLDLSTTQSVTLSMATTVHSSMATTVQSSMVTTVQSMVLDVPATTESPVDAFPPNVPTTTRPQSTTYSMTTFMTARDVPNEVTTVPVTSSMTLIIVIAATLSVATVMVLIAVVIIVICLVQRYRNGKKAVGDGEVKGASNIVDQQVRRNESDADLKSRVEGKEESMYALHGDHLAHLNRDKNDDGYTNIDECQRESGHIPPTTSTNLRDLKEKVQCETVERDKGHMEPHTEGEEQTTANHYEQIPHSELWHSNETTTDLKGYSCSPEYASLGAGRGDLQLPRYDTVKGYEQITGYEEPATYEVATTYQSVAGYEQVATYESAVTYQKVPTESLTALPQE